LTLGPIKASEESAKGEGNFYGVASNGKSIFITCNGDDTKGWIAKSTAAAGKPGALKLSIATKVATEVDAPVPAIFSPYGDLVVGQMGEVTDPAGDSLLTIYDSETGKLKKTYKTGLNDIAGLAYSPKTGKLYATDYSWRDAKVGGLFRLDITGDTVKATKIASLDKPTACAFDKSGVLYVAVFGTVPEGSTKPAGSLVKFDSGL
jgi:DNA-binding beta-propeller fold protein YncE